MLIKAVAKDYLRPKGSTLLNMDVGMACAIITAIIVVVVPIGRFAGIQGLGKLIFLDSPFGALSFAFSAYQTLDSLPLAMIFSLAAAITVARYVWEWHSLLAPITVVMVWVAVILGVNLLDVGGFVASIEFYPAVRTLLIAGTVLSMILAALYGIGVLYEGVISHHLGREGRRSRIPGIRRDESHKHIMCMNMEIVKRSIPASETGATHPKIHVSITNATANSWHHTSSHPFSR